MATRFYHGALEASDTIADDAAWDAGTFVSTRGATRLTGTFPHAYIQTGDANDTDRDVFAGSIQFPLVTGQTITGSQAFKAQFCCSQDDAGNNLFLAIGARIIASDLTTVRKVLLNVTRDDVEMAVGSAVAGENRQFTATTEAGDYTTVDGDILVFEFGVGGNPDGGKTHNAFIFVGDDSADDLPEDDSDTTITKNPWFELADTIAIYGARIEEFESAGNGTWIAPEDGTIVVEGIGGGAGGGGGTAATGAGGGGGGGEYRKSAPIAVTKGDVLSLYVGLGGTAGGPGDAGGTGEDTSWASATDLVAKGGSGGDSGFAGGAGGAGGTGGTGAVANYDGGAGGAGYIDASDAGGGGGGSSAGTAAVGDAGDNGSAGGSAAGGTAPSGGGNGGAGGGAAGAGSAGSRPGGGGGGGGSDSGTGAAGAAGADGWLKVTLTGLGGGPYGLGIRNLFVKQAFRRSTFY